MSQPVGLWVFDPEPPSCRAARRCVREVLEARDLAEAAVAAAQLVAELAANAVLHARTAFEVRLLITDGVVRIEVHDRAVRHPVPRRFSDEATSGRGLRLVEEVSDSWGVVPDGDGNGKTVWAELSAGRQQVLAEPLL